VSPKSPKNDGPGARRGKRVALAVFVAFAAAFILSSTWQVTRQVFGWSSPSGNPSPTCASAARAFEEEIDRALTHAAMKHDPASAHDEFVDTLGGSLKTVEKQCAKPDSPRDDRDLYVAAQRLGDAADTAAQTEAASLARLRFGTVAAARRP
jgi:hypothetical protein